MGSTNGAVTSGAPGSPMVFSGIGVAQSVFFV